MTVFTRNKPALSFFLFLMFLAGGIRAQCGFTANQRSGCQGYQLNLQDTTTGSTNTNWTVTFADNTSISTSNNRQATRIMSVCGRAKVTMTTTVGGVTCTKVDSNFIVHCPPVIRGTFSPHNICLGQTVCYTDASTASVGCSPLRYLIDWGQSPLDSAPGCRRYTLQGPFTPSVIAIDACGCRSDSTFSGPNGVNVTAVPVASFTGANLNGCATPHTSTMTAIAGGPYTIYKWYINGSTTPTQSGHSNVFANAYNTGTYSIKLITLDSLTGCADTMTRASYVTVGSFAAACFTPTTSTGCAPKLVNYCSCTPGALSYEWDFPGGNPSSYTTTTNSCINVVYSAPGAYSTRLIVYYSGGCIDTLTNNTAVTLGQPYTLGITATDTFSCTVPFTTHLTYTGQACGACTFAWNPPGNSTPNSHFGTDVTLTTYQSYTPVLIVTDPLGCQSTLIKNNYINAQKLKAKDVVSQIRNGCTNDTFLVTNTTVGGPFTSVTWSFPGGVVSPLPGTQDAVYVKYPTKGCHKYTMIVASASCIDTLRDSICVSGKPVVSLAIGPHDVCFEQLCNSFTPSMVPGTDTPTSILIWPEGITSPVTTSIRYTQGRADSLCYYYQNIGNFLPCFVPKNNQCIGDTVCLVLPSDTVRIKAPAAVLNKVLSCTGSNFVKFVNDSKLADSTSWLIDGVRYANTPDDTLRLTLAGPCGTVHTAILTAYNFETGCVHSKGDTFIIPCAGIDFAADGTRKGCASPGYKDTIRIVYANPGVTPPASIVWAITLGNGNPVFNPIPLFSGPKFAINLMTPGLYKVCVQLTYASGCVEVICKTGYISVSRPVAAFTVDASAGCSPFSVQFTNTSTFQSGAQSRYIWNFGDTSPANTTTPNPQHIYTGVNDYIASLTVVDTNNCTSLISQHIISNIVNADFRMSDTISCVRNPSPLNPLTFTNTSTGFVSHYQWTLPAALGPTNPTPGDVASFSSQFTQEGTGDVCLIASDQNNTCRDTICKRITIRNPIADYTFANLSDTTNVCPLIVVNPFIDSSKNDICSYYWDFGDGSHFDTARNASHVYTRPGNYPITHIVTSCHGCSDTTVKYTIRAKGPVVKMTADNIGGCPCTPVRFFISSYDADSLNIYSGNGTVLFSYLRIQRGTMANPTLDTVTFTYCGVGDNYPFVAAIDLSDTSCRQYYPLVAASGDSQVLIIDTPAIAFTHVSAGCGTNRVCFTDQTRYTAPHASTSARAWNFGDGTPVDSTPAPCHTYAVPGDYTVTLSIRNNVNCSNTISVPIHVAAPPQAIISADDTIGCVPFLIHFRDSSVVDDSTSIASGFWTFGDATGANTFGDTSHVYTTPLTPPAFNTVTLVITDGYGCSDTASRPIYVKPAATVAAGPAQQICLGDTTTLSGSGSAPLHWALLYNIDTTVLTAPRVWPRVDTTYYLRAGDLPRCYVYDSVRVNVSIITASNTATSLCLGQATVLTATAQSTHATISSYQWHFGDGTTGAGPQVVHVYPGYGTYIDSMIVTNSAGCRDTVYSNIVIGDKPHAAITLSSPSVCLGAPLTVTNSSTAGTSVGLAGFTIDMQPDGVADYTTSPVVHTYPAVGGYRVVLIQADANGCADTATQAVTVHSNPVSIFKGDSNCILLPNRLTGAYVPGDGGIAHYRWTINGAAQATSDSATIYRTFATPGVYNVCLSVEDVFGCQSPDSCGDLTIISQPTDTIDPQDTTVCLGYSAAFHARGVFTSIQWVPSVYLDNANSTDVIATPRQPMRYLVYASYGHCVPKVDTVTIYVVDSIPVEASANPENILLGLSSNVSSTVKGIIDSIVWDPDSTLSCRSCRNPVARPSQTTTYTATIYYSKNGFVCSNRASVTITVITSCDNSLIYVPNTFTPNNDGTNDVFRLRGQGISKVNYFRVYDRWGKVVYEATNTDDADDAAWNGGLNNDKAKPENSGVFVYAFEIQCITGQTITGKGNVTLIR